MPAAIHIPHAVWSRPAAPATASEWPESVPDSPRARPLDAFEPRPVLTLVRNPRARRYLLRLQRDGSVRVTVPRGGSADYAIEFVRRNTAWIARQLATRAAQPVGPAYWRPGTSIWFRGERFPLELAMHAEDASVRFADQDVPLRNPDGDLRPAVERHLHRMAAAELPVRVGELAMQHQFEPSRVCVRNQRSRWGSCSARRTISLNWRLIQTPGFVRDYIILHELAHLRQMNHSARFWRAVEGVCPEWRTAEKWLKDHREMLRL